MSSKRFAQDIAQRLGPSNIGRILLATQQKFHPHWKASRARAELNALLLGLAYLGKWITDKFFGPNPV